MSIPTTTLTVSDIPRDVVVIRPDAVKALTATVSAALDHLSPTTPEAVEEARGHLVLLQKMKTKIEQERKLAAAPFKEVIDRINEIAKPWTNLIEEVQAKLKDGMARFLEAQERERQKRIEEAANEPEKALTVGGLATPQVSTYEHTEVVIVDEAKLPREYLMPDMQKIRQAALAGTQIPGVEVRKTRKIAAR